jgi:hypothetical protein
MGIETSPQIQGGLCLHLIVGGIAIFGMSIKNISEVISNDKKA